MNNSLSTVMALSAIDLTLCSGAGLTELTYWSIHTNISFFLSQTDIKNLLLYITPWSEMHSLFTLAIVGLQVMLYCCLDLWLILDTGNHVHFVTRKTLVAYKKCLDTCWVTFMCISIIHVQVFVQLFSLYMYISLICFFLYGLCLNTVVFCLEKR